MQGLADVNEPEAVLMAKRTGCAEFFGLHFNFQMMFRERTSSLAIRPEAMGDVLTVEFTVAGIPCIGLNGGPHFKHNEAFSFQIATDDQAETDRLWHAIVGNGGKESACGWCKDRWGLSWQITPRTLLAAISDPDRAAAKRAFDTMMTMKKIDIAAIEAARLDQNRSPSY